MTVTLNPETAREHRIARSLGAGGWTVLAGLSGGMRLQAPPAGTEKEEVVPGEDVAL